LEKIKMIKAIQILEALNKLESNINESYPPIPGADATAVLKGDMIWLRTLGGVYKIPITITNEEITTPLDGIVVPLWNPLADFMDELKKNPEGLAVKVLDSSILRADPGRDRDQAVSNGLDNNSINKRGKFFNIGEYPRFAEPDMPDGSGIMDYIKKKTSLGGEEGGGNPNIFYMHQDGHRGVSD
jgi:hypothetical protein